VPQGLNLGLRDAVTHRRNRRRDSPRGGDTGDATAIYDRAAALTSPAVRRG